MLHGNGSLEAVVEAAWKNRYDQPRILIEILTRIAEASRPGLSLHGRIAVPSSMPARGRLSHFNTCHHRHRRTSSYVLLVPVAAAPPAAN
jgi:hypothetical protein